MDILVGCSLLTLSDLSCNELQHFPDGATALKQQPAQFYLQGKTLGLLFRKASTRTRVSFTSVIYQCGGSVIALSPSTMPVSRGEPIANTARVLSRYLDGIAIRTHDQAKLEEFAHYATILVINALTDPFHPCQIMADLLTIQEAFGHLQGLTLAYWGNSNRESDQDPHGSGVAVAGAQVVYTDVWASMGQEEEAEQRQQSFVPFHVNRALLAQANPDAIMSTVYPLSQVMRSLQECWSRESGIRPKIACSGRRL
jgi:ornithine carbamoyltransferase